MSDAPRWDDLVVTLDDHGRDVLARTAAAAVASLRRPEGPRSDIAATALHDLIGAIEICPDEGVGLDAVLGELASLIWSHSVVASDPATVAHLHPPTLVPAVATELLIGATNQSMDSWDQSPAATEVEQRLMAWLVALAGLPATGSGVMTSGGTASNVLAVTLARSWAGTRLGVDVLATGLPDEARSWRILCSDQAHFSIQRAAAQLGLGRDAVTPVATTAEGTMDVAALDVAFAHAHDADERVIAVIATAGTTDLGAFDPLEQIGARARRHDVWFHVDAAVGGAFLLSDTLRGALAGLESVDSFTVDFHKLWWQPFNASALVVRDETRFDLLRVRSSYLDRGDELEGVVNLVGRSLDTSRRFDAAKVFATLRSVGRRQLAAMLEHLVALTRYAGELVEADPRLELLASPTSVMCVFDAKNADADDLRRVQQGLLARGEMVLGRTEIKGRAALKFTFMNPLTTRTDVERLVAMVKRELEQR